MLENIVERIVERTFVRELCIENICLFRERRKLFVFYFLLRCSHDR